MAWMKNDADPVHPRIRARAATLANINTAPLTMGSNKSAPFAGGNQSNGRQKRQLRFGAEKAEQNAGKYRAFGQQSKTAYQKRASEKAILACQHAV